MHSGTDAICPPSHPPSSFGDQPKATPNRFCLRHTTRHGRLRPSVSTISLNRSGMKSGVTTSRAAPVSDKLRTVQSIVSPPQLMDPPLKMRRRGAALCSFMSEGLRRAPDTTAGVYRQPASLKAVPPISVSRRLRFRANVLAGARRFAPGGSFREGFFNHSVIASYADHGRS